MNQLNTGHSVAAAKAFVTDPHNFAKTFKNIYSLAEHPEYRAQLVTAGSSVKGKPWDRTLSNCLAQLRSSEDDAALSRNFSVARDLLQQQLRVYQKHPKFLIRRLRRFVEVFELVHKGADTFYIKDPADRQETPADCYRLDLRPEYPEYSGKCVDHHGDFQKRKTDCQKYYPAVQGDFRDIDNFVSKSPKLAEYLGIKVLEAGRSYTLPTLARLKKGVAALRNEGCDVAELKIFSSIIGERDYIDYHTGDVIGITSSGREFFHDMLAHVLPLILYPKKARINRQHTAKMALTFYDVLARLNQALPNRDHLLKTAIEDLKFKCSLFVDSNNTWNFNAGSDNLSKDGAFCLDGWDFQKYIWKQVNVAGKGLSEKHQQSLNLVYSTFQKKSSKQSWEEFKADDIEIHRQSLEQAAVRLLKLQQA